MRRSWPKSERRQSAKVDPAPFASARSVLQAIDRHFEEALACTALAVVAVCVMLQVFVRFVLSTPLLWTEEVAAIGMAWAVYMGAALCVRERFHIRVFAGVLLLPTGIARWIVIFADALWLGFLIFMAVVTTEYLGLLATQTSRTPALGIDELYPQSVELIGYVLMIVRLVQIYALWLRSGRQSIPGIRPEQDATMVQG